MHTVIRSACPLIFLCILRSVCLLHTTSSYSVPIMEKLDGDGTALKVNQKDNVYIASRTSVRSCPRNHPTPSSTCGRVPEEGVCPRTIYSVTTQHSNAAIYCSRFGVLALQCAHKRLWF